mgnify:CR=1 FL=1
MTAIETFHEDNIWKNRRQGDPVVYAVFDTKAEAVAAGREVAIREGVEPIVRTPTSGARNAAPPATPRVSPERA